MEGIAELFEDGRIRFKGMPGVGQLQKKVLDTVSHQFEGIVLPELISVEHLIGPFMDGEGGVEEGPLIEELLLGELHCSDGACNPYGAVAPSAANAENVPSNMLCMPTRR